MWGSTLSKAKMNKAPKPNPMAAGITFTKPSPGLIAIPGAKRLQKLAATITPPVKPSIPSRTALCMDLKKNTKEAPIAVTNHVNVVAKSAAKTGSILSKYFTICPLSILEYRRI